MPMKKLILIMAVFFTVHLYSQDIPLPQRCFPLNGTNTEDIMSGQGADVHGTVHALTDRFGINGKAISFDKGGGYFSFPVIATDEKEHGELTLTYWMYAGKDSIAQAFWAKDNEDNLLLGMRKKGRRAVLNIYHRDRHQKVLPDQQWMWEDSSFDEGEGWYFVAIAYSENGTRFYLATPAGKVTECYSSFVPDWGVLSSISVGTVDGISAAGIDDFKVYNGALSKEQISILYQSESQISTGNESLYNVETKIPFYSSTWYFHCVGLRETLQYVVQNQTDLSFVSADVGYGLSTVPNVESENQKWILSPMKDTAEGRIFTIGNCATGMDLSDVHGEVCQQVPDNTDSQRWYIGRLGNDDRKAVNRLKENNSMIPLSEEIYFDRKAGVIRVYIHFPEAENVKMLLTDLQGRLLHQLFFNKVTLLEKDIKQPTNGVYMVVIESDNYRTNRKIFVNN